MTRTPEETPALDPRAAALLATYRRGAAMPPAARARVASRLRDAGAAQQVLAMHRRRTQRGWAVVLAVAAAVALVWAVGDGHHLEAGRVDAGVMSPSQATPPPQDSARSRAASATAPSQASPQQDSARSLAASTTAPSQADSPQDSALPRAADATATSPPQDSALSRAASATAPSQATSPQDRPPLRAASVSSPSQAPPLRAADATPSVPASPTSSGETPRPLPRDLEELEPGAPDGRIEPIEQGSLRDETVILSRGWKALAAGDVASASAAVHEHARRFASGTLTPEREALAAVAACSGDRPPDDRLARAFLTAHPRSPLTRRVREACRLAP